MINSFSRITFSTLPHLRCNLLISTTFYPISMSNIPVHSGMWTDWSRGSIFGAYRTFTASDTAYIIGGTSAFITYVGGCAWSIYAYYIHRRVATRRNPDLLDLQHRLIYRNDATALSVVADAFWVYWTWKPWKLCPPRKRPHRRAKHVLLRTANICCLCPGWCVFVAYCYSGIPE